MHQLVVANLLQLSVDH